MIKGWNSKYYQILKEFNYNEKKDKESAKILESMVGNKKQVDRIQRLIESKVVFVIGAGPSLSTAIKYLKNHDNLKIVADSATKFLLEKGIIPDIVVTDLDGDLDSLKKIGKSKTIFVVHAHGDNISKLDFSENLENWVGTTQTEPFGKIYNFGGFTDGDRAVFLANHFSAKKIILFGMDMGKRIGRFSNTNPTKRKTKLKKLQKGRELLEWLAENSQSELFTTSLPMSGFTKIPYRDLDIIIT